MLLYSVLLIPLLFRRLNWIYTVDLVEAPFSVCEPYSLSLSQLVEAMESGDDLRLVRERAAI